MHDSQDSPASGSTVVNIIYIGKKKVQRTPVEKETGPTVRKIVEIKFTLGCDNDRGDCGSN
jgi:hypothetical protein